MGVGHFAAGLIFKRVEPRINLGLLFFAAILCDFLLGIFFWLGLEHATVPANYVDVSSVRFDFPYSHGLVASIGWAVLVFLLAKVTNSNSRRVGIVLALAVFSHFILDFIVHVPELPLLRRDSTKLGLGLWNHMTLALILELLIVVVGLLLYLKTVTTTRARVGLPILMLVFSVLTVIGDRASTRPDLTVVAISWLAVPLVVSGLAAGLDWKSVPTAGQK